MSFSHPRSDRRMASPPVAFIGLALGALVLAACTGAQPGVAQPIVPGQALAAATVAPTQAPAATQAKPAGQVPAEELLPR